EIRLPNSFTKLRAALPHVPRVSIATGTNLCAIDRAAYLADFLVSAKAAAAPGSAADRSIYDGAKVSGHVASQSKHLLLDHGTRVAPSGRLASVRAKPGGSRTAAMLALCSARRIVSFNRLCLRCRPALRLHASPWWPSLPTAVPQTHLCGSTIDAPSRSPTATRSALSSMLRPSAAHGTALSHAPDPGARDA